MESIGYYRVSTQQQGHSGLGLAAQKDIVLRFLGNSPPLAEFVEVESGKHHKNRPELLAALELCKKKKARLVVAKLDRLARNVAFISALMESGVEFVCCDNPHANRLMLHLLAAFAEHEREIISERVKAALGRVKADLAVNGHRVSRTGRIYSKLGGPCLAEARKKAAEARRGRTPSEQTTSFMTQLRNAGNSFRTIAAELNRWELKTGHGSRWYASTVSAALERLHECQNERKDECTIGRNHEILVSLNTSRLNERQREAIPSFAVPNAGRRTPKEGEIAMFDLAEANRMLDTFVGSGATTFDVTFIDIDGEKRGFRAAQTARQLRNSLPQLMPGLQERQQNIIVRPRSEKAIFVQLDDLDASQIEALLPVACLILETSPGNHQAWIAVSDIEGDAKDFARRLRKGVGADLTASGATRVAGTRNFKVKYMPDFPMVKILHAAPGRIATPQQLEAMGLVAPPEPVTETLSFRYQASVSGTRQWPDYQRALRGAKLNHAGTGPDISGVDFYYSLMCAQRGFVPHEIAGALMDLSPKADKDGQSYADRTAHNAYAKAMDDKQRRSRA